MTELEAPLVKAIAKRRGKAVLAWPTAAAVAANLLLLRLGAVAGATWEINAPESINAVTVIVATAIPMLLAGVIALGLIRRWPAARPWLQWAGLIFALAGLPMPFVASPDTTTAIALAGMHVVTGAAWFVALRPAKP